MVKRQYGSLINRHKEPDMNFTPWVLTQISKLVSLKYVILYSFLANRLIYDLSNQWRRWSRWFFTFMFRSCIFMKLLTWEISIVICFMSFTVSLNLWTNPVQLHSKPKIHSRQFFQIRSLYFWMFATCEQTWCEGRILMKILPAWSTFFVLFTAKFCD